MGFKEWNEFRKYLILRKDAVKNKYGIRGKKYNTNLQSGTHLINSLRYLDTHSQMLIKYMNNPAYPLRDRVLSTFVYRVTGDYTYTRFFAKRSYMFDLPRIEILADSLDEPWDLIDPKYEIEIQNGRDLKVAVASLLELWDNRELRLHGKKVSELYRELRENSIKGTNDFLLSEFIYDLCYIEELKIKPDLIPVLDYRGLDSYKYITDREFTEEEYVKFANKATLVHRELRFTNVKEQIAIPADVSHMLISFYCYRNKEQYPRRERRTRGHSIENVLIPRSLNDYIKSHTLHCETDRRVRRMLP